MFPILVLGRDCIVSMLSGMVKRGRFTMPPSAGHALVRSRGLFLSGQILSGAALTRSSVSWRLKGPHKRYKIPLLLIAQFNLQDEIEEFNRVFQGQ